MPEKEITGWLIVDWRDGSHRTRKNKPTRSELGSNELLAELNVDVHVPEVDVPTLAARIDVPEPRVRAATMDAVSEDDLPDWTATAEEALDARRRALEEASPGSIQSEVDSLAMRTLEEGPGYPDPELVREYIEDRVGEIREQSDA
jgi:hypothetical protein